MPLDVTITDHDIPLAVRDHGGLGEPVLLLHGLGGTLESWDAVHLAGHRTLAMDLRGHGHSGDGPWDWEKALDDVEAVIAHFALGNPVVAGHSLGGMLAVQWALRHPDCPAIVNLDGLRSAENDPGNYPGIDPTRELAALKAAFDAQAAAMALPLSPEMRARFPARALTERDGQVYARPGAALLEAVRHSPEFRDTIPLLRRVGCPALVVIPAQDPPGAPASELMPAFRRGVRRDLTGLPDAVRVEEIAASHDMLAEQPKTVSGLMTAFLTGIGQ